MDKRQYFIEALQAGIYTKKDWVISVFAVTKLPDYNPTDCYPYQLVKNTQKPNCYAFVSPDDSDTLITIEGTDIKNPLFRVFEPLILKPGDLVSVKEEVKTSYGSAFVNCYLLIYAFGDKIPYTHDLRSGGKLERVIIGLSKEYPEEWLSRDQEYLDSKIATIPKDDRAIYIHEIKKYGAACAALGAFAPLCAPAGTLKSMSVDPSVIKRRDELLAQHKHELNDPVVMAGIVKELAMLDKKSFEGDAAMGFLTKDKSFMVSRMKAHILYGIEYGMDKTSINPPVIETALGEGWKVKDIPALSDASRAASYDRGNQTALAGAGVKEIYRALQNVYITDKYTDCGSKVGLLKLIESDNLNELVNRYAIGKDNKPFLMTIDFLKANVGNKVYVRSPMYCKSEGYSYCKTCIGEDYGKSANGLHIAAAEVLSIFMNDSMKAMHGKILSTEVLKITSVFS